MENILCKYLTETLQKHPNRKVVIWGCSAVGFYIFCGLKVLEIEVYYFVDVNLEKTKSLFLEKIVKQPCELKNEKLNEILLIFAIQDYSEAVEWLKVNGLHTQGLCYSDLSGYLTSKSYSYDPILGYNRIDDLPGFKIYGNNAKNDFKIIALGNSTTDFSLSRIKSWPEALYNILCKKNKNVTIYNGGLNGYSSNEELLKLLRDVLALLYKDGLLENLAGERTMVISWCGAGEINWIHNNQEFPFYATGFRKKTEEFVFNKTKNSFYSEIIYGISNSMEDYNNWYKNIRCMHGIANEFEIPFYNFIQPCIFIGGYVGNNFEKLWLQQVIKYSKQYAVMQKIIEGYFDFYSGAISLAKDKQYIFNATDIFQGMSGIYMDWIHINEEGNNLIAQHIIQKTGLDKKINFIDK